MFFYLTLRLCELMIPWTVCFNLISNLVTIFLKLVFGPNNYCICSNDSSNWMLYISVLRTHQCVHGFLVGCWGREMQFSFSQLLFTQSWELTAQVVYRLKAKLPKDYLNSCLNFAPEFLKKDIRKLMTPINY